MISTDRINQLFDVCVEILVWIARESNMTYEEINVWLFCVIWPILTVWLMVRVAYLKYKLKKSLNRTNYGQA